MISAAVWGMTCFQSQPSLVMPAQLTSKVGGLQTGSQPVRLGTALQLPWYTHSQPQYNAKKASARTGVRDVHGIAGRVGSDLIYGAAARLLVNTCHRCTMRGQLESSRSTDALRSACHDRHLSRQHERLFEVFSCGNSAVLPGLDSILVLIT